MSTTERFMDAFARYRHSRAFRLVEATFGPRLEDALFEMKYRGGLPVRLALARLARRVRMIERSVGRR